MPTTPPPEEDVKPVLVEGGQSKLAFRSSKRSTTVGRGKGVKVEVEVAVKEEVVDFAVGGLGQDGEGESLGERIKRRRR